MKNFIGIVNLTKESLKGFVDDNETITKAYLSHVNSIYAELCQDATIEEIDDFNEYYGEGCFYPPFVAKAVEYIRDHTLMQSYWTKDDDGNIYTLEPKSADYYPHYEVYYCGKDEKYHILTGDYYPKHELGSVEFRRDFLAWLDKENK